MITIDKVNYILQLKSEGKSKHEIKDILGYKHLDSMTKYMRKEGKKLKMIYILNDDNCHRDKSVKTKPILITYDRSHRSYK